MLEDIARERRVCAELEGNPLENERRKHLENADQGRNHSREGRLPKIRIAQMQKSSQGRKWEVPTCKELARTEIGGAENQKSWQGRK